MTSFALNEAAVAQQLPGAEILPTELITTPYSFPQSKLKHRIHQADKAPLVLVACGSFSPITALHLQMFERSKTYAEESRFEVVGCYLSPVSDAYQKPALAAAHHRLMMCTLAVENTTDIMVDSWETLRFDEAGEPVYTSTVDVLRHFDHEINGVLGGIQAPDGSYKKAQISLVLGADVAMTMGDPDIWPPVDLDQILGAYGAFVVERPAQADTHQALDHLKKYDKIWVVSSSDNDISSTKIRDQLQHGKRVQGFPTRITEYVQSHNLYQEAEIS